MVKAIKQEWADGRLRVEPRGEVLVVTVKRPEVRNALDVETMMALGDLVTEVAERPEFGVLVLAGYGDRAFISGGDLVQLASLKGEEGGMALASIMGETLSALEALPMVTVAAIGGDAFGGGVELALACDLRIMERASHLTLTQARFGLTTGWGGSVRLVRLVGYSRALDLLLTMRPLGAEEALQMGLVNRVVDDGAALEQALELAEQIASLQPTVALGIKSVVQAASLDRTEDAILKEQIGRAHV